MKMDHINTVSLEEVFNEIPTQHRLSAMLKIRGTVAYRAARLAGMWMAKRAKAIKDASEDTTFGQAMEGIVNNVYVWSQSTLMERGEEHEREVLSETGIGHAQDTDMLLQVGKLVRYANKLNFDNLDLVDPSGKRRYEAGVKFLGVYHDDHTQREAWANTVGLLAVPRDELDCVSYAEYVSKMEGEGLFVLTEAEWTEMTQESNLYMTYTDQIVDCLLQFGDDEGEFEDLNERTQISLIEIMRGKLPDVAEKVVRSVKYDRKLNAPQRVAEASKLKGLVLGLDEYLRQMLDLPRYRPFAEFMYSYVPGGVAPLPEQVKVRRAIIKAQPAGRVDDVQAQRENGVPEEEIERELTN
jgi:hypothetical protein